MKPRTVTVKIVLEGTDVSKDLAAYLRGLTYEDNLSGEADTCDIELMDKDKLFIGDWYPPKGSTIELELQKNNWTGDGSVETLPLKIFEIDEVTCSSPPSVCKIKCNSIPQNSKLRQVDQSRSWEHVKLSKIAKDIADEAGMELFYKTDADPEIERAEQGEQSALSFLEKICADNYLCLKVSDDQLIIYDTDELEESEPVMTLTPSDVKRYDFRATLNDVYKSCEVKYSHSTRDETFTATATDDSKETGKVLKINKRVHSKGEAEKLAANSLKARNKKENTARLTTVGDFQLVSGNVISLEKFGAFNGKWIINKAQHRVTASGYETNIECYRV